MKSLAVFSFMLLSLCSFAQTAAEVNYLNGVFEAFEKVYENTAFSGGPFVEEFEKNYAKFIGTDYAVGKWKY